MRHDQTIERVAADLGLTVTGSLAGGQFGACRVSDGGDVPLVLKALPLPQLAPSWARGASMAERLRADGYPAPHYLGTGATRDACWSLQELLPGSVPAPCSPEHVRGLVALALRHKGAGAAHSDRTESLIDALLTAIATMRTRPEAAPLAEELAALAERSRGVELRDSDVVHADFHAGNFLALGDDITGVFDWEGAHTGDWRCDLANLVVTCDVPLARHALAAEPSEVTALFVGWHCARYLAFDITNHPPERLTQMLPGVEADLAHWWRATA